MKWWFVEVLKIELDDIEQFDKIILSPGPGLPNEHPSFETSIVSLL